MVKNEIIKNVSILKSLIDGASNSGELKDILLKDWFIVESVICSIKEKLLENLKEYVDYILNSVCLGKESLVSTSHIILGSKLYMIIETFYKNNLYSPDLPFNKSSLTLYGIKYIIDPVHSTTLTLVSSNGKDHYTVDFSIE